MWEKSSLFWKGYNQKENFDYLILKYDFQQKTELVSVNCPKNMGMLPINMDTIWFNVSVILGNMPMLLGMLYIFWDSLQFCCVTFEQNWAMKDLPDI